jgi:hypothetical protein
MTEQESLRVVRKHYPNALTTSETVHRLLDLIHEHLNIHPKQIMLADSICSDDVNTMEYPQRAYEMLGPFKMGGLNGFPFTGLTGMNAFAHHVPEDGAVFIYYAPHIGITKEGITGEINRVGQHKPSACCGAAKAALTKLLNGSIQEGVISELDYQQNTIEQIFHRQEDRILTSTNPLLEATAVMYEAINDRINLLASKTEYPCKYLILMGGILINGDHDMGSFNSCQRFEVIDLRDRKSTDMKQLLFR